MVEWLTTRLGSIEGAVRVACLAADAAAEKRGPNFLFQLTELDPIACYDTTR